MILKKLKITFILLRTRHPVKCILNKLTLQSGIRLLMDPKTGRILGTLNGNNQQQQPPPLRAPPPGLAVRMPGE